MSVNALPVVGFGGKIIHQNDVRELYFDLPVLVYPPVLFDGIYWIFSPIVSQPSKIPVMITIDSHSIDHIRSERW